MAIATHIAAGKLSGDAIEKLQNSASNATNQIQGLPHVQRCILLQLITRIDLSEQSITIVTDLGAIDSGLESPTITAPIGFVRSGRQIKLILPPANEDHRPPNPAMLKLVAQAFAARRQLEAGGTFDEVAARLGYGREYLADMLRTSFLSRTIVTALIEGRQPVGLSRKELVRTNRIPLLWIEQEKTFGLA